MTSYLRLTHRSRPILDRLAHNLLLAALLLLVAVPTAFAQGNGKGRGGGDGGGGGGDDGGGDQPAPAPAKVYAIEVLEDFGASHNGISSWARGVNDLGDVVGMAHRRDLEDKLRQHAFLNAVVDGERELIDLTDLLSEEDRLIWRRLSSASAINDPSAINDQGQIVQIVGTGHRWGSPNMYPFRLTLFTNAEGEYDLEQPPLLENLKEIVEELIEADDVSLHPEDINNDGDITGSYNLGTGTRAFLLRGDLMKFMDIGVLEPEHNFSTGYAVNSSAQVAGVSATNPGEHRAFFFDPAVEVMLDLGVIKSGRGGLRSAHAYDLNDDGVVVGSSSAGGWNHHAFRWDGGMQDLGTLGGNWSRAYGINNEGMVVGHADDSSGTKYPFLYVDGIDMVKLGDLVDDLKGFELITTHTGRANKINNACQIIGSGIDVDGVERAFILTPKPVD